MEASDAVLVDGDRLDVAAVVAVGRGRRPVRIDPRSLDQCRASRVLLEKEVANDRVVYGVNTSFGPMASRIISRDEIETLQVNLIRSHASGLGDPLPADVARGVAVVRLNTLVKGYSGVRLELIEHLAEMINRGLAPVIPQCGSVGASGDLTHLAHLALGAIGEGKLYRDDRLESAAEALEAVGLSPIRLAFKEGLALINGTAASTALAAFAVWDAQVLLNLASITGALGVEVFGGLDDAYDPDLHRVKPHPGQLAVADAVRRLVDGSGNLGRRAELHDRIRGQETTGPVFETSHTVQDVYSIRCTPQVLAPVHEAVSYARSVVEIEANSTNDNPVVIPDAEKVLHGGNFHGQSVAFAMDVLTMAVSTLCNLSERRINKYLDPKLNQGLPEHLITGEVGLTMGLMGSQYLATSTTAENRHLANPVSTLSISTNASNQDVVPMAPVASRKAVRAVENAKHVLTLEVMTALQALSFRGADRLGRGCNRFYREMTPHFTPYDNQRVIHDDLVRLRSVLFDQGRFEDLAPYLS